MGGCASIPKESNPEALPAETPASSEQTLKTVGGDPTAENKTDAESENKEEPLLDLSVPKQDTPSSDGELKATHDTSMTDLVSEIVWSNPESGDSEKVSEAGVKAADLTQDSETQKSDAGNEGVVSKSEGLKKDIETSLLSA